MERSETAILAAVALIAGILLLGLPTAAQAEEFANVNDKPVPVVYDCCKAQLARFAEIVLAKAEERAAHVDEYEPICDAVYCSDAPSAYDHDFRTAGVVSDGGTTYTWYSQNVLPGGGLDIPGRHVNADGFVCDGDGKICVASSDLPHGTAVSTPFGDAVVYDGGCASGVIDVYTAW